MPACLGPSSIASAPRGASAALGSPVVLFVCLFVCLFVGCFFGGMGNGVGGRDVCVVWIDWWGGPSGVCMYKTHKRGRRHRSDSQE
jgi:hypothetical protein